jgi:hypothetical protein
MQIDITWKMFLHAFNIKETLALPWSQKREVVLDFNSKANIERKNVHRSTLFFYRSILFFIEVFFFM